MIMAMVKINKDTQERELLWEPEMNEIDALEEIEAALLHYGDEVVVSYDKNGRKCLTGKKYHITFELVG